MTFTHCHALWVRLDDGSEANLIGIHSDGVRACVAVADDEKDDDDAGYIETLLVVPLCSFTILEEDRDMRCRSPAHLGVVHRNITSLVTKLVTSIRGSNALLATCIAIWRACWLPPCLRSH